MHDASLSALAATAALIGIGHTLIGPDHYVPFITMGRVGRWSAARTIALTIACGTAHVVSSVALGVLGILLGWTVASLGPLESVRTQVAAWLLLGFGLAYTLWGIRHAARKRPHAHWHAHTDGTVHRHEHMHVREHAQAHTAEFAPDLGRPTDRMLPWVLFAVFVFGPCEPLIPLLMYPAAAGSWGGVALVTLVFAGCTLMTMVAAVAAGYWGLSRLSLGRLERYSHALAGSALVACGLAIQLGL